MNSGILFHRVMIKKLYCNLVLLCLFFFELLEDVFQAKLYIGPRTMNLGEAESRWLRGKGAAGAMPDWLWFLLLRWSLWSMHRALGPPCRFEASAYNKAASVKPGRFNLSHLLFILGSV